MDVERIFYLNLFSDYIMKSFPEKSNSIIKILDLNNFIIVKGKTDSNDVLDFHTITKHFETNFSHLIESKIPLNTIDVIEYGVKPNQIYHREINKIKTNLNN